MAIRSKAPTKSTKEPWHSVSIVPGKNPCDAVLANPRRRMLPGHAARLPVTDCSDPEHCECRYQHHTDRRAGPRRTDDNGGGTPTDKARPKNRRRPGERRARD